MKTFLLSILVFFSISPSAHAEKIHMATSDINKRYLLDFTKGKPCEEIDSFIHPNSKRSSIEPVLICKALNIGDINPELIYKSTANYTRGLKQVESGLNTTHAESVWKSDINEDYVFVSDPIIRYEEFEKLFFARKDVRDRIEIEIKEGHSKGISSLETLKKYNVISSENWTIDWKTLKELGFNLLSTSRYKTMHTMVYHKRAHLLLGEPSASEDISIVNNGMRLYPIRGIKVGLRDSRHFIISKKHPNSLKIYNSLQKGVKKMREDGTIERAYNESKFFHPAFKDWEKL